MFHNTFKADVAMVLSPHELSAYRASNKQGRAQQLLSQGREDSFRKEKRSFSTENSGFDISTDIYLELMKSAKLSAKNFTSSHVNEMVTKSEISI